MDTVTRLRRRTRPGRLTALAVASVATVATLTTLAACGTDAPTLKDLPSDIASARPNITQQEATFVLDARNRGVDVTAATLTDDLETGTTTCWALKNGGVTLKQIAVDDAGKPLGNTGDALRTKQLMAAGVNAFCPDHGDQIVQLALP
jgi:predicted small lipoprotein YifL